MKLVTTNKHKLEEFQSFLHPIRIEQVHLELDEIQGTAEEVVRGKVRQAFNRLKEPVLVDDTGLFIHAWKDLPGIYIRHFLDNVGNSGVHRMLLDFDEKGATATCFIGYADKTGNVRIFSGSIEGKIVAPRGSNNFGTKGWDAIFLPKGSDKTFGEMSTKEKSEDSHRIRALQQVKKFLTEE